MKSARFVLSVIGLSLTAVSARDVREEIRRADGFGSKAASLVTGNDIRPFWPSAGGHFTYRLDTGGDTWRFLKVDLKTGFKQPAFDHDLVAALLSQTLAREIHGDALPLDHLEIAPDNSVRLLVDGRSWKLPPSSRQLVDDDLPPEESPLFAPEELRHRRGHDGPSTVITIGNGTDGEIELFWVHGAERKSYGRIQPGASFSQNTYAGHLWLMTKAVGEPLAAMEAGDSPTFARVSGKIPAPERERTDLSPDGKWRCYVRDHNVFIEPADGGDAIALSSGGTEGDSFTGPLEWSPDSGKLIAFRAKAVETRKIHIVRSSPPDQLQPELMTIDYPKPGDPIRQPMPRLFDIGGRREIPLDSSFFANPWSIGEGAWSQDSGEYSFVFNQRGHQVMRVIGIDGESGTARVIHEEKSTTFIDYSQKFFMHRLAATGEILWASERDGHNHLLLIDGAGGTVKNAVTRGDFEVREVVEVDEASRQVLFKYVGFAGQDPYHVHFALVNFDGSGFTKLTTSDGTHRITFSTDKAHFLDTWSRVDQPPVVELRRTGDGSSVAELERADDTALVKTGWSRPERFVAKGRDGKTDIHGIIVRPVNFDPRKQYPVVEDIYAGPHDHFVPKSYSAWSGRNAMAELGFIVVGIDGMGTNWRGKAFHDICWKNLMDAGLPDRIAWIKAAAESRPWMDLSRVGIYGGSAGGQSTLAALLHHGDFYKVGVADCGCHDNRMDKIWWNEAWMGWPVDESYERNSNVTHAAKLQGRLMLVVGEMDTNVDPASTAQVVHALQQAGKDFDFVPIMNAGHGAAETPYGRYRRADFLTRHLGSPR